jgi:fructokinase
MVYSAIKNKYQVNILTLGECLFDCFPDTKHLGGAPLNFAIQGVRLGAKNTFFSRVGNDKLGQKIEQFLLNEGVNCNYLQWDQNKPTGQVVVTFANNGEPEYQIIKDVAWDYLAFSAQLADNLIEYDCLYFGTLAQRNLVTKTTIIRYLQSFNQFKFLDLNLRTPYYNLKLINESIMMADGLKLNLAEAHHLQKHYGFDDNLQNWLEQYHLQWIVLTQGEKGTKWIEPTQIIESHPVPANPREKADSVGAGDAVAAVVVIGYLQGLSPETIISTANQIGAYVASFPGAIPPVNLEE